MWTGWTPIDPLLSVLVTVLILRNAWFLVAESGHILLESAPKGLDVRTLREDLVAAIPGVEDVHHVHAWSLTEDKRMVTLHARVAETAGTADTARISAAIKARLRDHYRIEHATVEVEGAVCGDDGAGVGRLEPLCPGYFALRNSGMTSDASCDPAAAC